MACLESADVRMGDRSELLRRRDSDEEEPLPESSAGEN